MSNSTIKTQYPAGVIHIECNACDHEVDVAPAETYVCPACGASEGLNILIQRFTDSVEAHEPLRTKGYDETRQEIP
jgi:hypothetical protein